MSKTNRAPKDDKLDAAVTTAAQPKIVMEQMTVTIATTGRPIQIAFPQDLTDSELLEFVGWLAQPLRVHLFQRRQATAGGRIALVGANGAPILKS